MTKRVDLVLLYISHMSLAQSDSSVTTLVGRILADRHTHTHTYSLQYFATAPEGEVKYYNESYTLYLYAFAHKQHVVADFFDLEKAYNMTWKCGILQDLKNCEVKGHKYLFKIILVIVKLKYDSLTLYLKNLNKKLESLKEAYSLTTLFILKINSITNCLAHDIEIIYT